MRTAVRDNICMISYFSTIYLQSTYIGGMVCLDVVSMLKTSEMEWFDVQTAHALASKLAASLPLSRGYLFLSTNFVVCLFSNRINE